MRQLYIDGARQLGAYRVRCDCQVTWNGTAPKQFDDGYSPLLPITEAVVHVRLEHEFEPFRVAFSERFETWLREYWGTYLATGPLAERWYGRARGE